MYKYNIDEMTAALKIGSKIIIGEKEVILDSIIEKESDLSLYYFENGKIYEKRNKIEKESITIDVSKTTPFFCYEDKVYCYVLRDGKRKLHSFTESYKNEYLNPDSIYYYMKDKGDLCLFDYLKLIDNCIRITSDTTEEELKKVYFDDYTEKCICCFSNILCEEWSYYNNKCSNSKYWFKYHDDYCKVNDLFLNKTIKLLNKKELTIVLVGCGNLYELEALNKIAIKYDKILNVVILDKGIWSINSLNIIKKDFNFKNIWFRKCDFYKELENDCYNEADIVYFSRSLIHYDSDSVLVFDKLEKIIKNNQLTVFSQVVNINNQNAVLFENVLRSLLNESYNNICSYKTSKYYDYFILKSDVEESIVAMQNKPLHYYLYVVEGSKQ